MNTMTLPATSSRWNISLWAAQILLLLFYAFTGYMKLTQPIPDLAAMMGWPDMVPVAMVRFIGLAEFVGGLGMVLPMRTKIQPRLTILAALGLSVLQVFAMIWHIIHGEFFVLPINLVLLALAVFRVVGPPDQAAAVSGASARKDDDW